MKSYTLFSLVALILLIVGLMPLCSAEIQYSQTKEDRGNGTMINRMVLIYSRGGFGISENYIIGNDPLETYIQYNIYVKKFNRDNPNYKVDYCNFKVQVWRQLEDSPVTVFERNYTEADSDVNKAQYFTQLYDGDEVIAQQSCYYLDKDFHELLLPAEMTMVMPTFKCKECQYYIWTQQQADIIKAESIGDNVVDVADYIKRVVVMNFEVILGLFWIFLILMIFTGVGLIFIGMYWLFIYLSRLIK